MRATSPILVGALTLLVAGCTGEVLEPSSDDPVRPVGVGADGGSVTDVGPETRVVSLGPAIGRRMTREELFNTLEVTLALELDADAYSLPRDNRVPRGFRNGAADQLLSPGRVLAYDEIAEDLVTQLDLSALIAEHTPCTDSQDACYDAFIDSVGVTLLRRPVEDGERPHYRALFAIAADEGEDFAAGAGLVLRAMLQSPRFLYRLEIQASDGSDGLAKTVDDWELATRLAFLVWNSGPDRELLDRAEAGTLSDEIEAQVVRLLDHPRARRALRQYLEQWLYLDAAGTGLPLIDDMKEETYRLFEFIAWEQDADLMETFVTQRAELSIELAEFYGLASAGDGMGVYDLSATPDRIGFTTNASVMTARTINASSSMIDRGLFVLNDLFCDGVPPPEGEELRAAIEERAVPESSGLSQRERFAIQSEDPLCARCHGKIDNLGLPFERFGSAGQLLTEDVYGNPLTGSGSVDVADVAIDYANVTEFAQAISLSETVARCLVEKSLQHAYGRPMQIADRDLVDEVFAEFVEGGRTYRQLILAIATHPEFAFVEVAE